MEACVLLGTGSSAKTGVFLCVSVNEGAIVDSGHGRSMGDHGLLVGVLMAARGRAMGVEKRASIGIEGRSPVFAQPPGQLGRFAA